MSSFSRDFFSQFNQVTPPQGQANEQGPGPVPFSPRGIPELSVPTEQEKMTPFAQFRGIPGNVRDRLTGFPQQVEDRFRGLPGNIRNRFR